MDDLTVDIRKDIVSTILTVSQMDDLSPDEISDETGLFQNGLGLDSVDALELIVLLEKQYGIKIRNDEKGQKILENVGSLVREIQRHHEFKNNHV